jgi:hypothetical protein
MSLFFPLLLLGLTQPVDSAVATLVNRPAAQVQSEPLTTTSSSSAPSTSSSLEPTHSPYRSGCFTMRSYIFERRDGYAPELAGMTTCTPAQTVIQKHIRGRARLVPAN